MKNGQVRPFPERQEPFYSRPVARLTKPKGREFSPSSSPSSGPGGLGTLDFSPCEHLPPSASPSQGTGFILDTGPWSSGSTHPGKVGASVSGVSPCRSGSPPLHGRVGAKGRSQEKAEASGRSLLRWRERGGVAGRGLGRKPRSPAWSRSARHVWETPRGDVKWPPDMRVRAHRRGRSSRDKFGSHQPKDI